MYFKKWKNENENHDLKTDKYILAFNQQRNIFNK